jgi:hypothetical protein
MLLGQDPTFWDHMTGPNLLGLSPATNGHSSAGAALPKTSHVAGDHAAQPWSPDSPTFWVAGFIALTVFGIAGASVRFRLGKGRAGAEVGST